MSQIHLFRIRLDNLACDRVDQLAVTNQRLSNFAVSPRAWVAHRLGGTQEYRHPLLARTRSRYWILQLALTSCRSPSAIHRPYPRDNLPEIVIGPDDLAKRRHRPDYGLGAFSSVAKLSECIGGTQLTRAKRD